MHEPSWETNNLSQETIAICHEEGWAYGSDAADAYERELQEEQSLAWEDAEEDFGEYDPAFM